MPKVNIHIAAVDGKVVLTFDAPTDHLSFVPDMATGIAHQILRAAAQTQEPAPPKEPAKS